MQAFATVPEGLLVQFRSGEIYLYSAALPGKADLDAMRQLASSGAGLTTYISRNVRERYALKLSRAEAGRFLRAAS